MIIDCDTHYLPPDAYDYLGPEWDAKRPRFVWDDKGILTAVEFPGAPPVVPGATPLEPPGTMWTSTWVWLLPYLPFWVWILVVSTRMLRTRPAPVTAAAG